MKIWHGYLGLYVARYRAHGSRAIPNSICRGDAEDPRNPPGWVALRMRLPFLPPLLRGQWTAPTRGFRPRCFRRSKQGRASLSVTVSAAPARSRSPFLPGDGEADQAADGVVRCLDTFPLLSARGGGGGWGLCGGGWTRSGGERERESATWTRLPSSVAAACASVESAGLGPTRASQGQAASHWCQPLPGILGGGRALLVAIAARAHGGARPAWGVPPRLVDEQELSRDMGVAEWEWEGWDWDDGRDIGCFVLLRPD
jgi:hypothetical protein